MAINLHDNTFWRQNVPFWNSDSKAPFVEVGFQSYEVASPSGNITIKSMLSSLELSLLFSLAKDYWTGQGEIVDLGCLYGLTTRCLADGVSQNRLVDDSKKIRRVYAYDLFLAEDYDWWSQPSETVHAGSWFSDFLKVNEGSLKYIAPCPGDLLHMNWGSKDIEILMIDASKTWELNDWIVKKMFRRFIPNQSIIIQQDQVHFYEYWTSITMEYFSDHFEYIDSIYGSSGFYLCRSRISEKQLEIDLKSISFKEKEKLLINAISRGRPSLQDALQPAYAKLLFDNGHIDKARSVIANMRACKIDEDPIYDFSGIALSDRNAMSRLIDAIA